MAKKQNQSQPTNGSQKTERNSNAGDVDNARLSSDMGETNDSLLEANRVDQLANRAPGAQQSPRADEGEFGERSTNRRPGTFGIDDTPNGRPDTMTPDREINEDLDETQKADDRR